MFREDPLLKVGAIAMAFALALVIVVVAVGVAIRDTPERAVASERTTKEKQSNELLGTPWVKGTRQGLLNPSDVFAINRHHMGIRGDRHG